MVRVRVRLRVRVRVSQGLALRVTDQGVPGRFVALPYKDVRNWSLRGLHTTLSGASLGSCINEEPSQLGELM